MILCIINSKERAWSVRHTRLLGHATELVGLVAVHDVVHQPRQPGGRPDQLVVVVLGHHLARVRRAALAARHRRRHARGDGGSNGGGRVHGVRGARGRVGGRRGGRAVRVRHARAAVIVTREKALRLHGAEAGVATVRGVIEGLLRYEQRRAVHRGARQVGERNVCGWQESAVPLSPCYVGKRTDFVPLRVHDLRGRRGADGNIARVLA